jgi:hypothetical protein
LASGGTARIYGRIPYLAQQVAQPFARFRSNEKQFLIGYAMAVSFYAGTRTRQGSSMDPGAWFVEADRVSMASLTQQRSRARFSEKQIGSAHVAIVSTVFLVLFTAALLIGGRAAIDPMLQSAAKARESSSEGAVVVAMPDGIFCRHMSFNNATAQETEEPIERCQTDIAANHGRGQGFSWRTN